MAVIETAAPARAFRFSNLAVWRGAGWLVPSALAVAALLALPILGVSVSLLGLRTEEWAELVTSVLPRYGLNTLWLALGVGIGTAVTGVATAWVVTMYRFPGRRIFQWALILPLAAPAYVLAYAYTDFLQHAGPVQSWLREVTGWGPREYWFPNIRSLGGAILVFTAVFYPYVYVLARASFLNQCACVLEASRSLGATPWGTFRRVALPLARPAIAAGVALALMETLADFGAVAHFGVQTFTTGIYRAWFSLGDRMLAAQLATALLAITLLLLALERVSRSDKTAYHNRRGRFTALPQVHLKGLRALAAMAVCFVPVAIGFLLPAGILLTLAVSNGHDPFSARYVTLTLNSFTLAGIAAVAAVAFALLLNYAVRLRPSGLTLAATRVAGLGYALPGSIIAVGILIPLASFDNAVDAWMRSAFGVSTGLLLTGSIVALIYAYLVRFMTISLHTVEASLSQVTPHMDAAARSLGAGAGTTLARVHLPIISGGLMSAGLIVFVEVLKELPATAIIRPFNFDTLAIQAYRLASDERLAAASTASLLIIAAGLIPVIFLSRTIMRSRPGQNGGQSGVQNGGLDGGLGGL